MNKMKNTWPVRMTGIQQYLYIWNKQEYTCNLKGLRSKPGLIIIKKKKKKFSIRQCLRHMDGLKEALHPQDSLYFHYNLKMPKCAYAICHFFIYVFPYSYKHIFFHNVWKYDPTSLSTLPIHLQMSEKDSYSVT